MSEFAGAFPAPTWTPPAREPFVPLRPLTLGQILSGSIRALRSAGGVALAPAVLASVGATVLASAISWLLIDPAVDAMGAGSGGVLMYQWLVGFGAGLLSWVVLRAAVLSAGIWQQGVAASIVTHAMVGRRLTAGGLRRRTRGTWGRQSAWAAIVFVSLTAAGGLLAGLIGLVTLTGGALAALIVPVIWIGAAVALAWIGTRLAFVPSVLTVERTTISQAVRRSRQLTRRSFWRTFGTRILTWTMIWFATMIIVLPVMLLMQLLTSILAGNGAIADVLAMEQIASFVVMIASAAIGALGLVITSSTDALVYVDLRMRAEGLDLVLARFVETRRPGTRHDPSEVDPFQAPAPGRAAGDGAA